MGEEEEGGERETDRALLGIHVYSLVPRLLGGEAEPGTHCLRMCKNVRSKRICEVPQPCGKE